MPAEEVITPAEEPTEPAEEPATMPAEEPTEPAEEPATEPAEEPTTSATAQEGETETDEEFIVLSFYDQLMACYSLSGFEALLYAEENAAVLNTLTQEEWKQLLARVEEIYAGIAQPTEADTLLKEELLKKLSEHIIAICPECGEADGHAETCSQYTAEPAGYLWAELTDPELAAWLMEEVNADLVKAIMTSDSEESAALNLRIEAILSGEDTELALQLHEYLSALLELDEQEVLEGDPAYIYFDLAAGEVTIGGTTYTGYVYVGGTVTKVTGTHKAGNKYYVYQSTDANRAATGYEDQKAYDSKTGCRIPAYPRVQNGGTRWTDYVTNNTDVYAVSSDWEGAAKAAGRTGTEHRITFNQESNYTADVTVDNIWSTYHEQNVGRATGGIGADLDSKKNTKIRLRLKGDNRVGNVHYSAEKNYGNQIIFSNGEDAGHDPGSITVADFPSNIKANYWCSAIGSCDNSVDRSDGIVIESGVIYAGTTWEDNCTAIGGGGNAFGRVTIYDGTVTAVTASTGTAIGGGIGWGSPGGDTEVTITGGNVYAYNLGVHLTSGVDHPSPNGYSRYVPAAAIGGGSSENSNGNANTTVTITGGNVYAQSMGGAAIGGGGSANKLGGKATINISGGNIIAKSTTGKYKNDISAGVSIGGGTGHTGGGSVTLNVSGGILRTGSIGGGKTTNSGNIGSAKVTITDGDITGQVIMAGGAADSCLFDMSGGTIHGTNVIDGNAVDGLNDPRPGVPILYIQKNGGAVWMEDPNGITNISGGTIQGCTAELGGAVYMAGGTFTLSGTGTISGNTAKGSASVENTGMGGAVYVSNGTANVENGSVSQNTAEVRGGGLYVTGGNVKVSGGSISGNRAEGRGGGVCLPDGSFTMEGGTISGNTAGIRGGGIFLTKKPVLTAGIISGNKAADSGGGLCINGDALELTSPAMQIFGNEAVNGGGVAVLNGNFILKGGAVGVDPVASGQESTIPNKATKGGGVYVKTEEGGTAASATVYSGNIWYNEAEEGGGIYLDKGEGTFTLEGANASVSHNTATNGGGIYLYKNPLLNQGTIASNTATGDGGGMYISDCVVTLNPASDVTITGNSAQNGAGIYIHGSSGSSGNTGGSVSVVDAVSSATPAQRVGLLVDSSAKGTVRFTNNKANVSGGAVCVTAGYFVQNSDKITVTGNEAANGGGVAVLKGNFTMSNGSIGEENEANTATNGGGVYVSEGEVWLKGGSVKYNKATDGGGAYVTGGKFFMIDGSLANNEAAKNGGGAYVAGDFRMLGGTVGGEGGGNSAQNGGGVYVSEGNVTVVYGIITHNHASKDGGGSFVSATGKKVDVVMLSGSLSSNTAVANGGGMAVESSNQQEISVKIGCLLDHNIDGGKPKYPIQYEGAYTEYAEFDNKPYAHAGCPEVKYNSAGNIGGGFYLNSDVSTLYFYCVEETGNSAAKGKEDSEGMDVEGGRVIIGDEHYHNHKHDADNTVDQHGVPWGYVSMDNATLVTGGVVDIYGDMVNPVFNKEVTVNIKDTTADHFMDHRLSRDGKRYKVHYIENFFGTGLYQARQYNEGNTVITIEGALYSHPGYQILGWYTKPEYDPTVEDPDNRFYAVGEKFDLTKADQVPNLGQIPPACPYCDSEKDDNLLMLYAIWEANGYTVVFDPNVPQEDTYTGTMDDQIHYYGSKQKLTLNTYQYPGHFFNGWNTRADGSGTSYTDGAEVTNLTDKNGVKVVLYAQWAPCDHTVPERWSYDVINDKKTLRRICSCGGQTLTATLDARDTVYDGQPHPATLVCSDEDAAAWGDDMPKMAYTGEWLKDGLNHEGSELELPDGIPLHAGVYTATITKPEENAENAVTASIQYTIAKADQPAPESPTYTAGENQLTVDRVADDPRTLVAENISQEAKAQYRLSYYSGDQFEATEWQTIPEGKDTLPIIMENAWTSYNVEVRYEELNDYNASDITRADAAYHYEGNVTVKIICDEGINYNFKAELDGNKKFDGATMTLETKDGYYIVGGEYSVQMKLEKPSAAEEGGAVAPDEKGIYHFTSIPDGSTLTITIGTARKNPQIKAQVAPGQVFRTVTGDSAAISRDSAFTAAFQISNFDPWYEKDDKSYGVYTGLNLTFAQAVPEKTTVILLDRRDGSYWYYRAGSGGVASVPLNDFKKMGGDGDEKYSIPQPGTANGYINLSCQFIVDFSQSAGGYSKDSLMMTLEATVKDTNSKAPEVKQDVTVSMGDPTFTLANTEDANGLIRSFTCSFNVNGVTASKWEKRASALVLTPKEGTVLPPDARIRAEVAGVGTTYLYKNKSGTFIVPLSLLQEGDKTVKLTLQSALFPQEEATYSFTAGWRISPSKAGKAPIVGDLAGSKDVTFVSAAKAAPSLKPEGRQRVLTSQERLELKIEKLKMEGYTISAALLRKSEDGTYNGIGWNASNVSDSLSVPLGGHDPGSFCLMLTVKKEKSIDIVMEVPYYFIIKGKD